MLSAAQAPAAAVASVPTPSAGPVVEEDDNEEGSEYEELDAEVDTEDLDFNPESPTIVMQDASIKPGALTPVVPMPTDVAGPSDAVVSHAKKIVVESPIKRSVVESIKPSVVVDDKPSVVVEPEPVVDTSQTPVLSQLSSSASSSRRPLPSQSSFHVEDITVLMQGLMFEARPDFPPLGAHARTYVASHSQTFGLSLFEVIAIYEHVEGDVERLRNRLAVRGVPIRSILYLLSMIELDNAA